MTDKTEAMDNLIAQDADLIEICPDDLVRRLRDLAEEWFEMCDDIHEPLYEAAERIEAQAADIERLRAEAEAHYDRGYYDGYTYLLEQHEALREALGAAPLIGLTESVNDFMARRNAWLNGPYRAALEQSK